jgi:hypothetical protein
MAMTIQWIEYPISIGDEDDEMTITWDDGSTDLLPANNGDGETIFQLPRLMDEVFRVENFNCFPGQSGQFIDEYPALFRSKTGAHVLRVNSEESFMNAFVCQSRSAADCLISWMRGDLANAMEHLGNESEGSNDFHWVSLREVLGFIASGLLDDFPPIIFEPNDGPMESGDSLSIKEMEKIELPWWYPPERTGPSFGYPASIFVSESYVKETSLTDIEIISIAISVSQRLSESEWRKLSEFSFSGSIAEKIQRNPSTDGERFQEIMELSIEAYPIWRNRWDSYE